jgi:hypothetical protein
MCKGLWDVLAEEYDKDHHIERHAYNLWRTSLVDVLDYPTFKVSQVRLSHPGIEHGCCVGEANEASKQAMQ